MAVIRRVESVVLWLTAPVFWSDWINQIIMGHR